MKLKDLKRGIAYTVTKGVPDGTLSEGDVVAICSDGCLLVRTGGGWLDTNDPEDMKYIQDCEYAINNDYYLAETQTSAKFAPIPRIPQSLPWSAQLDAIAEIQHNVKFNNQGEMQ